MAKTLDESGLIAQIFAHATTHPEALALIGAQETLSYGALRDRVGRIAAGLKRVGIGPEAETLVGVDLPRGIDAVCLVLGIVAAGGVYVPLDRRHSVETRQRMTRRAGLTHVVTDTDDFADLVPHRLRVADLAAGEDVALPIPAAADRLLHVLYTSGSTDEPKGVLGTHGQMLARLAWLWRALPLEPNDIGCHKTALHFVDASLEIFGTLAQGRPLVLAPDVSAAEAESFVGLLARRGVTRLYLVVSQLRSLLLAVPALGARLPALGLWVVSGERLPRELVETFAAAAPEAQLINLYGCSEAPEISWVQVAPGGRLDGDSAPIGHAIDGLEAHIVDDALAPVAPGETGELLVGGPILARGYLNLPAETARRFIDSPFRGGRRLYRTGDRVRRTADGLLWHQGRADDQVKVRGHRVELSAVEAALMRVEPALAAVKAVVQEDPRLPENRSIVAFVAPDSVDTARLAARMKAQVPPPMQPQRIVALATLPTTASGKIDRRRLAAMAQARFEAAVDGDTRASVTRLWRRVLMTEAVGPEDRFFEVGGDSLRLAQLHQDLEATFPRFDLSLPELLAYPTITAQAAYLDQQRPAGTLDTRKAGPAGQAIAVIGIACRFPGAETPDAFWANLRDGVDGITDFTDAELQQPDAALRADPDYVKAGAVLDDVAGFDPEFFGMSEAQASRLDPQHRLLLECAWEAMERAALPPGAAGGRVGVFAGSGPNSYFLNQIATPPVTEATMAEYQDNLAADRNFLATRIAYRLGLTGPALTIQSACSTGLVVVHQACQALRAGTCEAALAAAVSIKTPQRVGYLFEEGMIRSPDGRCRAFDAAAQGTLFGNGAGVVVLKPLAAARADGDPILAVITGTAVNNDGMDKAGYAAPSASGQAEVVAAALADADVDPSSIGYVEAHGTGTRIGDPIEISALTRAYTRLGWTPGTARVPIGSVKTNIGHLDEAAGMAGLIKIVLMLQHRRIPPSLHFRSANPAIDFESSPFTVATALAPWRRTGNTPRRAGVSSFGMGGTNAHLVVEEPPLTPPTPMSETPPSRHLLALSAPTAAGLSALVARYRDFLAGPSDMEPADLCATAALGRRHFEHRLAVVGDSTRSLRDALATAGAQAAGPGESGSTGRIAFVFSGQGAQYPGMARGLYAAATPFRETLDQCAAILDTLLPRPLFEVLFEGAADADGTPLLSQTQYTQPALVAVELALVALWRSWGVEPDIVLGHSIGEYAAACTAGVFALPDVLAAVAERGRLMQALPSGSGMLAVGLDAARAEAVVSAHPGLCVAAVNAASSSVLAGDTATLDGVMLELEARGVRCKRLDVSHGFHSPAMEPMLAPLKAALARYRLTAPSLPVVSNIDGGLDHDPTDPGYWVRHTRAPVRFVDGVETLRRRGVDTIIEIGPSAPLLGLIARADGAEVLLPSLRRCQDDWGQMLTSLGRLYEQGRDIEWSRVFVGGPWRKRALPTMPFQRRRCWIDRPAPTRDTADLESALRRATERLAARGLLTAEQAAQVAAEVLAETARPSDWTHLLYRPVWAEAPSKPSSPRGSRWLILADRGGVGAALATRARAAGIGAIVAAPGAALPEADVDRIVHLRALDASGDGTAAQHAAIDGVLSLVPWLGAASIPATFVTRGAQSIDACPGDSLAQALVWGVVRTLVLEGTVAGGGLFDLDPTADAIDAAEALCNALTADTHALYRGATCHGLRLERSAPPPRATAIRPDATYLVTGGVGALGLEAADALADLGARHLVLTSRRGPTRDAQSIRLDALRRRGVSVDTPTVDVADEDAMGALLGALAGPPLRGIIHAAGAIAEQPRSVPEMDRVARTLRGKVDGAVILDRLARDSALELFVLFSSAAGLLGLSGHADYAAANAALDALAARRHARGMPALSLAWGDWVGLGMAADVSTTGIAAETGLGALSLGQARAALRGLLGAQGHWAIIDADWPAFVAAFGAHAKLLAPLLVGETGDAAHIPGPPVPSGEASTPVDQITERVARLLGCNGAALDRDESLLGLGFDSLMLITLRNQLRRDLGLRIPLPRMLLGPSIAALAAEIAGQHPPAETAASETDGPDETGWTTFTL